MTKRTASRPRSTSWRRESDSLSIGISKKCAFLLFSTCLLPKALAQCRCWRARVGARPRPQQHGMLLQYAQDLDTSACDHHFRPIVYLRGGRVFDSACFIVSQTRSSTCCLCPSTCHRRYWTALYQRLMRTRPVSSQYVPALRGIDEQTTQHSAVLFGAARSVATNRTACRQAYSLAERDAGIRDRRVSSADRTRCVVSLLAAGDITRYCRTLDRRCIAML